MFPLSKKKSKPQSSRPRHDKSSMPTYLTARTAISPITTERKILLHVASGVKLIDKQIGTLHNCRLKIPVSGTSNC